MAIVVLPCHEFHSWLQVFVLLHRPSAFRPASFYAQVIIGSLAEGIAAHAINALVPAFFVE
jgi:hypothetical protein